jgi:nitrogen fixation/metabolism regulation signal transduction histidine kinase
MVFKNFRVQVIFRLVLVTSAIITFSWCLVHDHILRGIYLAVAAIILTIEFIWYVDRFNRDMKNFMQGLLQRDFTTHYHKTGRGQTFDELYEVLNQISGSFRKISAEKEIQFRYLAMLVEHVRVGIISIDNDEKIHLVNQTMKDLLQKDVLTNLKSLSTFDESLVRTLREIHTGETKLLKLKVHGDLLQLSIHASEFKLDERYYKLISMQNIRNELDTREMEAWQKLIRVLSHEIMNSVSPISSLSETLHGLVKQNVSLLDVPDSTLYNSLDKGLEAIRVRSQGLYNFTQSYRKLTGVPKVTLKKIKFSEIMTRVESLMKPKLDEHTVKLVVSNTDISIDVDPELLEHVLINLILNAIEAVAGKKDAVIRVKTSVNGKGSTCLHVEDNGEGIEESLIDKIFIPFFTTRKHGSGIGLALTKQILQLHQADIRVKSEIGLGTEFIIVL